MKKSTFLELVSLVIMVPTLVIAMTKESFRALGFSKIIILLGIMLVVTILLTYADWYKRMGR